MFYYSQVQNKRVIGIFTQKRWGGWNFCLKWVNGTGEIFSYLKFSKLIALLLTVAFMRVLKWLECKTKSILVS